MVDSIGLSKGDIVTAPFDHDRAVAAIRELLIAIGENPEREGLRDTPARVARIESWYQIRPLVISQAEVKLTPL